MRNAKPGISKQVGYIKGIYSVTYDLQGMVRAFGEKRIHALIDLFTVEGELSPNDIDNVDLSDYEFTSSMLDPDLQLAKPKRDAKGRFVKRSAA